MLGDFKFLGSSESGLVAMVAEDLKLNHLARAVVVALQSVEEPFITRGHLTSDREIRAFTKLTPLANLLYGIVEAKVSTGSYLLLRELEDRVNAARALERFEVWRKKILERQRRVEPNWQPASNKAMWMLAVNWAGLNDKLLEADRQTA